MKYIIEKTSSFLPNSFFLLFAFGLLSISFVVQAQEGEEIPQDSLYNKPVEELFFLGLEEVLGDTLASLELETINVYGKRFQSREEELAYYKLKRNIVRVYPYAQRALKLLEEIEKETELIERKRHEKKYLRSLEKELKGQFQDELTKLSVSQGKVLVKLIERKTGEPFYTTLRGLKNPVSAVFWQGLGRSLGYDLKEGYNPKKYSDMEGLITYLEKNGIEAMGLNFRYKKSKALQRFEGAPPANTVIKKPKPVDEANGGR
ncbi:MAG: DUF4294 domain-containing protein [Chitinophagales bacterium]